MLRQIRCAIPDGDRVTFSDGACLSFAAALANRHCGLRLALITHAAPGDQTPRRHVVAHDDTRVYDAAGSRPRVNEIADDMIVAWDLTLAAAEHAVGRCVEPFYVAAAHAALSRLPWA